MPIYPEGDSPLLYRWGKNKYSQEGSNPLLSMPPADRRRGQRNDAMHRPRRDKNAEAFLKGKNPWFSAASQNLSFIGYCDDSHLKNVVAVLPQPKYNTFILI